MSEKLSAEARYLHLRGRASYLSEQLRKLTLLSDDLDVQLGLLREQMLDERRGVNAEDVMPERTQDERIARAVRHVTKEAQP
jgi:hypothetical protein